MKCFQIYGKKSKFSSTGFYLFANVSYVNFFINILYQFQRKNRFKSITNGYEYGIYICSQWNTIKLTFVSNRSHSQIDWDIRKHSQVSAEAWSIRKDLVLFVARCKPLGFYIKLLLYKQYFVNLIACCIMLLGI